MKVRRNRVVRFDYELRNGAGDMLGTTGGEKAIAYLHGHGKIVPGLEHALEGVDEGDQIEITLGPEDGYGDRDPEKIFKVAREQIPANIPLEPGVELVADDGMGHAIQLRVLDVDDNMVTLDANHPLAGETLNFRVKVLNVRDASAEEILSGSVEGEDIEN